MSARRESDVKTAMFDIGHPAHVHLFRHPIRILEERGWRVVVLARDKDVVLELLKAYGISHAAGSVAGSGALGLAGEFSEWVSKARRLIRAEKVDVVASVGSPAAAVAAKLEGAPHIAFNDTETARAQRAVYAPLSTRIYVPEALSADYGPKMERYKGLHDLSYLRPERFQPDSGVLKELGVDSGEPYAVVRFVSWSASHDVGPGKTTASDRKELVDAVSAKARVFISAEGEAPEGTRLALPAERLHDALAYASLVVGDGATTATEAAVLGTPSVFASRFAGSLGCLEYLGKRGLLRCVPDLRAGIDAALETLDDPAAARAAMAERRRMLLEDTIDVAAFIADKCAEAAGTA